MQKLTGEFIETVVLDGKDPATKLYCTDFLDSNNSQNDEDKIFNSIVKKVKATAKKPVLVVSIDASHAGFVNNNFRYYKPETGDVSAKTWISPYPKPVLVEHRLHDGFGTDSMDPIGRVIKAFYEPFQLTDRQKNDIITRKGVQRVYSTIVGADNIEKVMDGRYLTVSTRGVSNSVRCSICKQELTEDQCEHEPGKKYENRLAYMVYDVLTYREWSYVKLPADVLAQNRRYELVMPDGGTDSADSQKIMSIEKQIRENIGGVVDCNCPDAAPNVSIYYMPDKGIFFDMLPSNVEYGKIKRVLDGIDLYECKNNICGVVPKSTNSTSDVQKAVDNVDNNENQFSDQEDQTKPKEVDSMDIKTFEDLMKLDFVKKEFDAKVFTETKKIQDDLASKDKEVATLRAEIEAKDKVISEQKVTIEALQGKVATVEAKTKEELVDKIVELQKKVSNPIITAILKKEKETQEKELKTHRDSLVARDNVALDYLLKDLQAEAQLIDASNAADKGNGITSKAEGAQAPVNGQTADSGKKPTSDSKLNPIDKLF